jgi:hypothetical protein
MDEKLEQPTETCGLVLTFVGGIGVKVNLKSTKQRVIEKIQDHLSKGRQNLIQFETTNPEGEEVCMFNPKTVLAVILTKEFLMQSGRIVPASMAVPGAPPQEFKH